MAKYERGVNLLFEEWVNEGGAIQLSAHDRQKWGNKEAGNL
jgi:hypothetical protein